MKNTKNFFPTISLAILAAALPGAAHAAGFYLQEQSVKGAGRAFSGEAADQGAESLWWNPASIGGMTGGEAHLGLSYIKPSGDVVNNNTTVDPLGPTPAFPVGGQQSSPDPITSGVLPSGAIAYGLSPRLAFGLSVSAPYSFETNYDADSWARYMADRTKLRTYDIQPTVAFMLTPELSLGFGLNFEYAKASLSNYLFNPLNPGVNGHQELEGDGWDTGWSAGAQFRHGPLSLGLSYKSAIEHTLSGSVTVVGAPAQNGVVSADAKFTTPWQTIGSVRYALNSQWTLNAQVVRIGWSEFDTIELGAPLNTSLPENYRDTWSYAVGFDYQASPTWTLRAGVQYDQTPTRDGDRDARVPDASRLNFAVGASHAVNHAFTIDAAANYIAFDDFSIDRTTVEYPGTLAQTTIRADGRLQNANAVVLSLGGRFKF